MKKCKKFLAGMLTGGFILGVLFAIAPRVYATNSNPIMAADEARRNANYVTVYNEDTVAHEAGDVCIYVLPASATYPGLSVSTTSTANVVRVAGVVPYGETLAASSWGRLQVYGYHRAVTIAVANSEGDALVTSTTGEAAGVYTLATSTTTVGADKSVFGVALEATTSSTTVKALLRIQ
jgi:hypothetical protein